MRQSLVFDTPPLDETIEILGAPVLTLEIASDKPIATLIARLCDVHPTDESLRVSFGVLNLTHRDSHAEPTPLVPGAALPACGSSSTTAARPSRPGIAFGWRSPPTTGRWSGPRPRPRR